MNTRLKIAAGLFLVLITAMAIVIFFPKISATEYGYFDVNNGRQKLETVSFGLVHHREIKDTEYSKLLTRLGYEPKPVEWRLASRKSIGLRNLFPPGFVDYDAGTIEAQSRIFAIKVEMKELDKDKAHELVENFQVLVRKLNGTAVREYVNSLE